MAITLSADDKKKAYLLGAVLGVLGLVGIVVFVKPFGGSNNADTANVVATNTASMQPTPGGNIVSPPGVNRTKFGATTTAVSTTQTAGSVPLTPQIPGIGRTRNDPFQPEIIPALPPALLPRRRVLVPVPVSLPRYNNPADGFGLPPASVSSDGPSALQRTLFLPPATIFGGTQRTAPPDDLRFPGGLDVGAPGADTQATSSTGKRVAGVILGDSIRALIEYQENGQTVSKVVQPGDEVGGMKILSIQRVKVGDAYMVRVTVRENGQEEFFELGAN